MDVLLQRDITYLSCTIPALYDVIHANLRGAELPLGPAPTAHVRVSRLVTAPPHRGRFSIEIETRTTVSILMAEMIQFTPGILLNIIPSGTRPSPLDLQAVALFFAAVSLICELPPAVKEALGSLLDEALAHLAAQAASPPVDERSIGRTRDPCNQDAIDRLLAGEDRAIVRADWEKVWLAEHNLSEFPSQKVKNQTWNDRVWQPYLKRRANTASE